jgi:F-type H+-transporting ATPase subunit gamma
MAQLIHLRQRIAAVETIKKITHAMRLIAMSTYSKLKNKEETLQFYKKTILELFATIQQHHSNADFFPQYTAQKDNAPLLILVGSQRGLCGNFNHALFTTFDKKVHQFKDGHVSSIAVGKKAVDYLLDKRKFTSNALFDNFTLATISLIAQEIVKIITDRSAAFTSVVVIGNQLKTFFLQVPEITHLIPFTSPTATPKEHAIVDYIWEGDPAQLHETIIQLYLQSSLEYLLFQSLLAEQAARFLSMDNATRNAQQFLDTTTLQYNKLRQAKITRELTELVSSLT